MRHGGAGQRWGQVEDDVLRKTRFSPRSKSGDAPLVQTFQPPGARPVSVNLTFLSSRPKLGRILANTFWLTYQTGPRRKTVLAVAWALKIFYAFLDHRAESMPEVLGASDLNADILKEYAVWRSRAADCNEIPPPRCIRICACFLRKANRSLRIGIRSSLSGSEASV